MEFGQFALRAFHALILGDAYTHKIYYMGLVDARNTHALPGRIPLRVGIHDAAGELIEVLRG